MPSLSDIFSDKGDTDATTSSSSSPFVPDPGEGGPDDGAKPDGGDGGSTIASGSTAGTADDFDG